MLTGKKLHFSECEAAVRLGIKTFFFLLGTRTKFFICSFLIFEVFLDDNPWPETLCYHTTATNHFMGFSLPVS